MFNTDKTQLLELKVCINGATFLRFVFDRFKDINVGCIDNACEITSNSVSHNAFSERFKYVSVLLLSKHSCNASVIDIFDRPVKKYHFDVKNETILTLRMKQRCIL